MKNYKLFAILALIVLMSTAIPFEIVRADEPVELICKSDNPQCIQVSTTKIKGDVTSIINDLAGWTYVDVAFQPLATTTIYWRTTYTATLTSSLDITTNPTIWFTLQAITYHTETPTLPAYGTGTITWQSYGTVEASPGGWQDAMLNFDGHMITHNYLDIDFHWIFEAQTMPFDDQCSERFVVTDIETYRIDPVVETPLGPTGSPPDEQIATVIEGQIYMIQTAGGPWNDGEDDRWDTAVSWDGETWMPFEDLIATAKCVEQDPVHPELLTVYVEAVSNTFHIRVDDTEGDFADNTEVGELTYTIGLAFETAQQVPCESQFTYDEVNDWVASVDVHSEEMHDVTTSAPAANSLELGEWYAIEVASGTWTDNSGPPRVDMEFATSILGGVHASPYVDLAEGSPLVWCQTEDGLITFIQADNPWLFLRANDQDAVWANNVGTLNVNIYHAAFTRTLENCELQYDLGTLVSHDSVSGNAMNGKLFGTTAAPDDTATTGIKLAIGATYILDTVEGPWTEGSTRSYDMDIKAGNGDWEPLETWSAAICVVPTDSLGHVRVYFKIPEDTGVEYSLRVAASTFLFAGGHMAWDLYWAIDYGVSPTGECDYKYDPDVKHMIGTVHSNAAGGDYINGLSTGDFFAVQIESTESHWYESGADVTGSDDLQLTVNGSSFTALPAAPGVLCYFYTPVEHELVFFIRPQNGQIIKMRADSISFGDNVGNEDYTVYEASVTDGADLWDSCIAGHEKYVPAINPHEWIPVKEAGGTIIHSEAQYPESAGLLWAGAELPEGVWKDPDAMGYYIVELEYGSGPWFDGETSTQHYNAQLSYDNGATWVNFTDEDSRIVCASPDDLRMYWKALIHVETGDIWKIRVGDTETDTFDDNCNGHVVKCGLAYILYDAGGFTTLPGNGTAPGMTINGIDVCTMTAEYPPPLSLSEIADLGNYFGAWVNYLNIGIAQYFAWCDRHTDMLFSVTDLIKRKEPFATLDELENGLEDIKRELQGYNWGGEGEDLSFIWGNKSMAQIQTIVNQYVLDEGRDDNPWDGGQLVTFTNSDLPSYYYTCVAALERYKGFAKGVCYPAAMMRETSAMFWIQLIFDAGFFFMVVRTYLGGIFQVISMFTGVPIGKDTNKVVVEVAKDLLK